MQPIEVLSRLSALRRPMLQESLDALLVVRETNVTYLSGYTNHDAFLLLTGDNHGAANIIITDSRYTEQAGEECPDFTVMMHRNGQPEFPQLVANLCAKFGVRRLGFEHDHISFQQHRAVSAALKGVEFCPTADIIEDLRKVKDAAEAERLREACAGTDKVFADICGFIRPGLTEREVEWQLLCLIRGYGFDVSFPPIVVSGPRGSLPHGVASDKVLVQGEFLTMDFGCKYLGYCADITRTVFIGRPTEAQRGLYNIVLEANRRAEAILRPGLLGSAVDAAARDYIAEMGYGANFGHGLGHGVGLDVHERVFMNKTCMEQLEKGCFVTVEPGIYVPGQGGVRIEDTVLLTDSGCENMFTATKELICL